MTKTPTRMQFFYAEDWPIKIWITTSVLVSLFVAIDSLQLSFEALKNWQVAIWSLIVCTLTVTIGFLMGFLWGMIVLPPSYQLRAKKNGAPFAQGDSVLILAKPYRGRIARVYSLWQGDSVRVDLGDTKKKEYDDVFSPTQLLRVSEESIHDPERNLMLQPKQS